MEKQLEDIKIEKKYKTKCLATALLATVCFN